jgi:hydrogenase-4 component B
MNQWQLILTGIAIASCVAGGVICLGLPERIVPKVLAIASCAAAVLSFIAGAGVLIGDASGDRVLWSLPILGPIAVGTTRLGSLFTCITALVYVPTSLYTIRYLERYMHDYSARAFACWYTLLLAAIIALFICRDVTSFFVVWEVIAIASAALVAYEWRHERHARAAFVMLAMSEAGTVAAILAVLLTRGGAGSLLFGAPSPGLTGPLAWAIFLLSFFGFGVKAGLLPVNSWLPRAHPIAPGNVSALLSGVILNLGVYGIILVNLQLVPVRFASEGVIVLIVGASSALIGILYATIEDDLKTMLAYSSVENLGIAVTALGVAFVFTAEHQVLFAAIGFAAGIYHVANHSAYKGLLFLGAATVDAKLGGRSMNRLGGVIRVLPFTTAMFFVGVLAIAALPPLNGFTSEWMTFQALLRSVELSPLTLRAIFALCGAALALTAALAVTCFVKAFGMTFLGQPRTPAPNVTEAAGTMKLGMAMLALECVLLGTLPTYVLPAIGHGAADLFGSSTVVRALVPPFFKPDADPGPLPADFVATFHALGAQIGMGLPGRGLVVMLRGGAANPVVFAMSTTYLLLIIIVLLASAYGIVRLVTRSRHVMRSPGWGGGLEKVLPEMTYTATGFSNPVRVIFDAVFNPTQVENERETIYEHFRSVIRRKREDVFLADRILTVPATRATLSLASFFARMHHGRLPAYVGYVLATLIVALAVATLV